jgi:hypothetical protein
MKRHLSLTIAIMMLVAVWAITAQSQATSPRLMRAHIPFAFNVGNKELPAGEYIITVLNPSSDQKVLQIRSTDGRVSAIVSTVGTKSKSPEKSKVVFHCYGDTYFFAQAQVSGESTALAAFKSKAERTEARTIANRGGTTAVTIVAEL